MKSVTINFDKRVFVITAAVMGIFNKCQDEEIEFGDVAQKAFKGFEPSEISQIESLLEHVSANGTGDMDSDYAADDHRDIVETLSNHLSKEVGVKPKRAYKKKSKSPFLAGNVDFDRSNFTQRKAVKKPVAKKSKTKARKGKKNDSKKEV